MSANFDPRSPSTSYAGSAPGTPLNPIHNSNIPSVGPTGIYNSPLRPSSANPVHRLQKSAGVKQLYTSDWINGFAHQPKEEVPSRPGSTAPSVCSDMSAMSQMSKMSGMSQFSTLSVNTNLTGFTQVYEMQPQKVEIENAKPNVHQQTEWMNDFVKKTTFLLEKNEGDKAIERLKTLCIQQPKYFDLPAPDVLNRLFLMIFAEIERICKTINLKTENPAVDGRLCPWIFFICGMYQNKLKQAILAIDSVLLKQRKHLLPDFCNLLLPNRKFSLQMVLFMLSLFLESGNCKSAVRQSSQKCTIIRNLLIIADKDFTNATTRGKALHTIRSYIYGKKEMEGWVVDHQILQFILSHLLAKELEEPVIFNILKLISQLLNEKRKTELVDKSKARQQFYEANGIEIISNLMKTHGSSRVIHECLIVVVHVCKYEIASEHLAVLLPALFQLYGANDLDMTGYLSSIMCNIAKRHRQQVLSMGGVGNVLHMLSQLMSFDPNEIFKLRQMQNFPKQTKNMAMETDELRKKILGIAENCLLALQYMGNISEDNKAEPQFMDQMFRWRNITIRHMDNPNQFDAGVLLLDYLAAKVILRKRLLIILLSMSVHEAFRMRMLAVRGGEMQMELSQIIVAIIFRNYRDYEKEADQKYSNDVLRLCWYLLGIFTMVPNDGKEPIHLRLILNHLDVDYINKSQRREPLTLLEKNVQPKRDTHLLKFVEHLVQNYKDAALIFNTERQYDVIKDLCNHSDSDIKKCADNIHDRVFPYPIGFHSMTPQATPNYGFMPSGIIYSDDSDSPPNLNHNYPCY